MLSLYQTLSLRYFQQRWSRALLVVASIALGVALLVATRSINETMRVAAGAAVTPLAEGADLSVSNGDAGVKRALIRVLAQVPGVRGVEPLVFGRVRLPDQADPRPAQLIGILWKADRAENNPWAVTIDWTIAPDSVPGLKGIDPQELLAKLKRFHLRPVLVGEQLAAELNPVDPRLNRLVQWMGKSWADKLKTAVVRLQPVGKEPWIFIKVGTVRAAGAAAELVKNALIVNTPDAAELLGQPDLVSRIDVYVDHGADPSEVAERIKQAVDGNAAVRTKGDTEQVVEANMAGLELGFSITGAGALVVGLFLIYLVLAVSVAERRHEVGILRSLGATRSQVVGLFAGEAAFLGLAGSALGIPLGLALAPWGLGFIQRLMSDFFQAMAVSQVRVSGVTLWVAADAGVVTALLAALIPAVQAVQEEPASAVRRIPPLARWQHRVLQLAVSCGFLAAGTGCMVWRNHLPSRVGMYGGFTLVLLGLLLTTPLLVAFVSRLFQPVARWLLGIEGRLAADNLLRAPGRTGLVITVLAAGVAMFVQTAGVIRSNEDPIMDWVDQTLDADLFVTSGNAIIGSGQNLLLQNGKGQAIEQAFPTHVAAALPVRTRLVDCDNNLVFLMAFDAAGFEALGTYRGPLVRRDLYSGLSRPGKARTVVSENFAALYHVKTGSTIHLRGPHGPIALEVIATVPDYNFPRGTVMMDRGVYQKCFDDPLADRLYVYLRPGADVEGERARLADWGRRDALLVLRRHEVRKHILNTIRRFSVVAYAQELVVGIVAALGLVFSLLISVLQRRRELGILRAVGATRHQVLRSVLAEAGLMGAMGTLIGLLVGVPVEWYIMRVIEFEETGCLFPTLIPWVESATIVGAALVIATLSGLWPALRTMRLRIPEAIAYE